MAAHMKFNAWVKKSGYLKTYVAEQIGCNAGSLSAWLSGKREPARIFRERIEKFTGGEVPASGEWK